jgi:hypothetical protein
MRGWIGIALLLAGFEARAQTITSSTSTSTTSADLFTETSTDTTFVTGYRPVLAPRGWSEGETRSFVSATVDVGYLYFRPRMSIGYGKPHAMWVGIEGNPIFSGAALGIYGGVRAALPWVDIRAGVRAAYSFEKGFLDPHESFNRLALATRVSGHATYATWETELTTGLPIGPGELQALTSFSVVEGVDEGKLVYEETLRVIVKPPFVWRVRGGYSLLFPVRGARGSVGGVVDVFHLPGRGAQQVRAGLVFRVAISAELEVRGSFVPMVFGRDRIGLLGGDFTELGLRWRWATGR